jgi:Signal transduction histidine kinase
MRTSLWADRLMALSVRAIGLVIMLAALAAAVASFFYNKRQEADQAERIAMQVNARLSDQLSILEAVRALYQSDRTTGGTSVRAYLAALQPQTRAPGMQGVGVAIAMTRGVPAPVEARLRENYGRDITAWPASDQPIGFPIILIEPDNALNAAALGYDMYTEPTRREAMRRAWLTGQAAASGVVHLVQERQAAHTQPGFLIYVPVYAERPLIDGGAAARVEEELNPPTIATAVGARPLEAFVYAPFRVHDLMTAVLGEQIEGIEGIEVFAGEGPSALRVFSHGRLGWDAHEQKLQVADRQWTMRISYGRFVDRLGRPLAILLFGVAIAFLAIQLHQMQHRRLGAFQALAEEKERHAEDRELMMGEMAHRMKNAFARISALARITLRESMDLADFERRFEGRLQALSASKQMLVTGAVDMVDLGAIIRRELHVAGWPAERLVGLADPEIHLGEDAAQAISLAVHELVTNSIKYGALAGRGDLRVSWRREGDEVQLDWVESGLSDTPHIATESFGTQFIRTLIERQLKGSWTRRAGDHSLAVAIRWPLPAPD